LLGRIINPVKRFGCRQGFLFFAKPCQRRQCDFFKELLKLSALGKQTALSLSSEML
jgi:hypothetical protein